MTRFYCRGCLYEDQSQCFAAKFATLTIKVVEGTKIKAYDCYMRDKTKPFPKLLEVLHENKTDRY